MPIPIFILFLNFIHYFMAANETVRESSDIPCAIGFGIAAPEQAKAMAALSDGAIVGSAIVKLVAQYGRESVGPVADYVRLMKAAVKEAEAN